jgi:hypothetical protein
LHEERGKERLGGVEVIVPGTTASPTASIITGRHRLAVAIAWSSCVLAGRHGSSKRMVRKATDDR